MAEPTVDVSEDGSQLAVGLEDGDVCAVIVVPTDADQGAISSQLHRLESVAALELADYQEGDEDVPEGVTRSDGGKYGCLLEDSRLRTAAEGS